MELSYCPRFSKEALLPAMYEHFSCPTSFADTWYCWVSVLCSGLQENLSEGLTCAPRSLCGTEVSGKPSPEKLLQVRVGSGGREEEAALNVDSTPSEDGAKHAASYTPNSSPERPRDPNRYVAGKMKGGS